MCDSEELTECCSCLVTPDGLLSKSVNNNLTANPITGIKLSRGVIKVIASATESDVTTNFAVNTPTLGLHGWMTHIQGTKVTRYRDRIGRRPPERAGRNPAALACPRQIGIVATSG
jgi:hypothetical protein